VVIVDVYLLLGAWVASYAIRQMRAVYVRAEEMRSEAVSALSHDLKNPLTIIEGYASMAETADTSERMEYLTRIRYSARQALDLVRNALDAAAIEGRPIAPTYEPVRLNELVEQVVDLYRLTADGKQVRVVMELAPTMPILHADDQLLRRAFGNLLSNAIKYTTRNGTIRITTALRDSTVVVTVADNGQGIAAGEQSNLFQKYGRTTSAHHTEGTGLGLYIVRRIAEAHRGKVFLRSELGRGSAFTIELPLGPEM
jgi:signal transduction histidine kinase